VKTNYPHSIAGALGVPANIQRAVICFGFDHSPNAYPKGRSDETAALMLARTLKHELLNSCVPIIVALEDAIRWYKETLDYGIFIEKETLRYGRVAVDAGYIGDPFSPVPILCEVERIAQRYGFYRRMSANQLRLAMIRKYFWWQRLIDELPRQSIYLNANAPHTTDDYIAYHIFKARRMATFNIYRLPIFEGLSSRLMVFTDPFDQRSPVQLNSGEREPATLECVADDLAQTLDKIRQGAHRSGCHDRAKPEAKKISHTARWIRASPRRIQKKAGKWGNGHIFKNMVTTIYYKLTASRSYPKENYIYFPLHMQPEASSIPLGGVYSDQGFLVEAFSRVLPAGMKLVVKEHPLQFSTSDKMNFRSARFYASLRKMDNVMLVHHSASSDLLIQNSIAAVTLTGTTVLEALAYGRYCFVLGSTALSKSPNALVPANQAELQDYLDDLACGQLPVITEEATASFFQWIEKHSVFGYLDPYKHPRLEARLSKKQNIAAVSDALIHSIKTTLSASA